MIARFAALAPVVLAVVPGSPLLAAGPRNVVVLLADDRRNDTLGCARNPVVKTPRIDAMARDGLRFTRACMTTSICGGWSH